MTPPSDSTAGQAIEAARQKLLWRLRHNETAKHLCGLAADELEALRAQNERYREALKDIARQELPEDMSVDQQLDADFEGAYQTMIELARERLLKDQP